MRILVDIGHPAHVHYFRNLILDLSCKHDFVVTTKKSAIIERLLRHYGIEYRILGNKGNGLVAKVVKQVDFTYQICKLIKSRHVDMAIGVSVTIAQASRLCGIPSVYFDDDDLKASPLTAISGTPFATVVLSPDCLKYEGTKNAIYYPGYHELAYLHPKRFVPNPNVLHKYGLQAQDEYFILRFNAFKAHHDIREGGMTLQQKRILINILTPHGKVFITSEANLDHEFREYQLPIAPHEMHDFLAFSQMLVSDSQTMSSEAAVLGIPSFRCNSFAGRISYLEEEEKKYGLTYGFLPNQFEWMITQIKGFLEKKGNKNAWQLKRQQLLSDKIDVTAFWVWFIDNYPATLNTVKHMDFSFERFK